MNKEQEWEYRGNEKISDLNQDADVLLFKRQLTEKEIQENPVLATNVDYIHITQNGFDDEVEKPFRYFTSTLDIRDFEEDFDPQNKSKGEIIDVAASIYQESCLPYESEGYPLNKNETLLLLDSTGVDVHQVVEREEDLGDLFSPSIYHDQTKNEKRIILDDVLSIQPGDELTYTLPNQDPHEFPTKVKHHLACIGKDELVSFTIGSTNLTDENSHVSQHIMRGTAIRGGDHLRHFNNNWEAGKSFTLNEIQDIKINKGRFTEEELERLKEGRSIDFNKVAARKEIPDKEAFFTHVLQGANPKQLEAADAMYKETHNKNLPNEEHRELSGRIFETTYHLNLSGNKELRKAVTTLHDAAMQMTHEGLEGQKMATACVAVANGLAQGCGLDLATTKAEKEHAHISAYVDIIKEQMESRYPKLDKGIEEVISKREKDYYLKDQEKSSPKKAKGLQRKATSKNLGR